MHQHHLSILFMFYLMIVVKLQAAHNPQDRTVHDTISEPLGLDGVALHTNFMNRLPPTRYTCEYNITSASNQLFIHHDTKAKDKIVTCAIMETKKTVLDFQNKIHRALLEHFNTLMTSIFRNGSKYKKPAQS